MGGKRVTFEDLDKKFATIVDKKRPVVVRIDKEVVYERVIKLFDMLKKHDLNNLSLANNVGK